MPIWRMVSNETGEKWVIELRDITDHKVLYTIMEIKDTETFKQDLLIENAWWTGITAFQGDKLVVHQFEDSENPEMKGFYIWDIKDRKVIWSSENFVFVKLYNDEIYGYEKTSENREINKIISLTDQHVKIVEQNQFEQIVQQITEIQEKNKAITYPFYYPENHAYFATVVGFLQQLLNIHAVKGCEYIEFSKAIIISYYIIEDKLLVNYLLVINHQQEVQLHERIGSHEEGIGTDTFFIVKNRLIFIKEKYHLISYALDEFQ